MDRQIPEVGVNFGDFQNEARYKRLERTLKLSYLNQADKGHCVSQNWPSCSNITVDTLDSTSALQVSRVDSEVVSSSKNLLKVLALKRNSNLPMATSSVKKFSAGNFDRDREIMPPPPSVKLMYYDKIMPDRELKFNTQKHQGKKSDIETETAESSNAMPSTLSAYQTTNDSELPKTSLNDREHRIFQRWRVLLNDQGQLILKGTLSDCGKIARSKPVVHRFSRNKVQSVYKHIYFLDGNILDEKHELPEYVRGKFYNGFPDDWENVHKLWKNFVSKGCRLTFRWPTPITDSDDDIVTEITDFAYRRNKEITHIDSLHYSNSVCNNATSSGYHSKSRADSSQNSGKEYKSKVTSKSSEIVTTLKTKTVEEPGHNSEIKEVTACVDHDEINPTKDSSHHSINSSNMKYSSYLHGILQEDKLCIIRLNLGDKNCPPQYLDKFIELIDCLRYLLSFAPSNETAVSNETQNCLKCTSAVSHSESQEINVDGTTTDSKCNKNDNLSSEKFHQTVEEHMQVDQNQELPSNVYNNPISADQKNDVITESSDSDAYMGIPNIPFHRLLKIRTRSERYRDVKNRIKEKHNSSNENQTKQLVQSVQDQRQIHENDSSISITEDDLETRHMKKGNKESSIKLDSVKSTFEQNDRITKKMNSNNAGKEIIMIDVENVGAANSRSTPKKRVMEKPKPVIKSNETVHIDLESRGLSRKPKTTHSAISDLKEEVSAKRQKLSRDRNNDKLTDDLLQHPFLTYDSEDFPNIENNSSVISSSNNIQNNVQNKKLETSEDREVNKKILQESYKSQNSINKAEKYYRSTSFSKKKKLFINDKATKSEPFGSKENPKLLTSWTPRVTYENELKKNINLVFEGKLLNEAGHVLNRKFVTDAILKRHSSTLIETTKNEFYMLVGEISDTKHAVPKELLKQCRTGCPTKIKEFCENWRKFQPEATCKVKNLDNTCLDLLSMPTSSRGRKILPPLNFWEGERVVTKQTSSVYQSGDVLETSLKIEIPKSSPVSNTKVTNKVSSVKANSKTLGNSTKIEITLPYKNSTKQLSKRAVQLVKNTENKLSNTDQVTLTRKKSGVPVIKTRASTEKLLESTYTNKLRQRKKIDLQPNSLRKSEANVQQQKPLSNIVWSYEKKQIRRDVLSDDQTSVMN